MFYEGDLQSGIADAINQAKLIACFVHDDKEESKTWENEFLKDFNVSSLLQQKALLLSLQAGSQEANYLAAIYPLPKIPTLVVIQSNGQLKEYLAAGVIKEDFLKRVTAALHDKSGSHNISAETGPLTSRSRHERTHNVALASSSTNSDIGDERHLVVGDSPQERNAHVKSKMKEQELTEDAERPAATARTEISEKRVPPDPRKAADMKYALIQKKRQEDDRKERERILKRVEDDKVERRETRELLRREQQQTVTGPDEFEASKFSETNHTVVCQPGSSWSTQCAIQVRLFDGTMIKSRFCPSDTLGKQVRSWVDSQHVGVDSPYTFKQILNPQPNRTITISEEEESLQSLGLSPSATFVLVAIKDYTAAYNGENKGYLSRGLSAGLLTVSSTVDLVTGAARSLFRGVVAPQPRAENGITHVSTGLATAYVGTLEDHRKLSEEHQLYNGNTLNFEPRVDMETEEE